MIMVSDKGSTNPKGSLAVLIAMIALVSLIALPAITNSFNSGYISSSNAFWIALCHAVICGIIASYIIKESSFFFLGLLLGEIGIAIAIIMHVNNKQKGNASSKISSEYQQPIEDKYTAIEHLNVLRKKKIITEKEFQAEKNKLLNSNKKTGATKE